MGQPEMDNDTIPAMSQKKSKKILVATGITLVGLMLLAMTAYRYPPINKRIPWRVEFALTYIRGILKPAGKIPTAVALPAEGILPSPTLTPSNPNNNTPVAPTLTPTTPPQPSPTPLPVSVALSVPAYEKQDMNNCGPASLTMYLRYYGWQGDQFDITKLIKPERKDRNVNVDELAYFVRNRAGWLNAEFRVGGDLEILKKFLAAGLPVMIEEGFYLNESFWPDDDRWAGHYLLLTGYDENNQTFSIQDSFREAVKMTTYESLKQNWQAFNYVYLLVYPPDQQETVKSIMGEEWDADVNRQHALEKAKAETLSAPDNPFAWFNLGSNQVYFERYVEAAKAYDSARNLGLPQRMLLYQFGPYFAYFHSIRNDDLLAVTEFILNLPSRPYSEEAHLWHGWALYRNEDITGAIADFRAALEANPNYQDAQYALNFVGASP